MLLFDPEDESALQMDIVVAFMPATQSSVPGAREARQWVQKQAIKAQA